MHWNMGDVPEWVGSVGTAAAFLLAAFVYRGDREQKHQEERERHARLFDAWVDLPSISGQGERDGTWTGKGTYTVHYANSNPEAMRSVAVDIFGPGARFVGRLELGTVQPTAGKALEYSRVFDLGNLPASPDPASYYAYIVAFTDPAGRSWTRDSKGTLAQARESPPK